MRLRRLLLRSSPVLLLAGCAASTADSDRISADVTALPAHTVMLSAMMRQLSAKPGFTEQLLAQIEKGQSSGAVLTPRLFDLFRRLTLGKDWSGLDRFPGWTIARVTTTVDLGKNLLVKQENRPDADLMVQLGPYALHLPETASLDAPSDRLGFSSDGLIAPMGDGVVHGDGADPRLAPMHAESARLAEVLNRLSLNGYAGAAQFAVSIGGQTAATPQQLVQALAATGHQVTVADARYFANFGHLHFNGQDVEMPFWLDSGLRVPAEHWWQAGRPLLVPVAHAEYEWRVTGPKVNADVTFYFGIDGHAEFRTNDQLNQAWVMGRHAHEYRGEGAAEVTRLSGLLLRAYAALHAKHPALPFGGYYTLGVCQDGVAAIEQHMTGRTTIFPDTARTELFHDQPDEEITRLMEAIPRDTGGAVPAPERIFGSLPTTGFAAITIPGLRADVEASYAAWQRGDLPGAGYHRLRWGLRAAGYLLGTALVLWLILGRYRRSRERNSSGGKRWQ